MVRTTRHLTLMALFSVVGIALFVIESFIPMPLPFVKIGLANVSTLLAVYYFRISDVLIVVIIRIVAGSLFIGSLFSPGFLLALVGGFMAAFGMAGVKRTTGNLFSTLGISLIGAVIHVVAQIVVVRLLFVQSGSVFFLLPMLLVSAMVGGVVVGWMSLRLIDTLRRIGSLIPHQR